MSICDNCPCNTCDDYGDEYCGLDLEMFDAWDKPNFCPDGETLKARRDNSDLVLVAVPKEVEYLEGWTSESSGPIWLWVKDNRLWKKHIGSPGTITTHLTMKNDVRGKR